MWRPKPQSTLWYLGRGSVFEKPDARLDCPFYSNRTNLLASARLVIGQIVVGRLKFRGCWNPDAGVPLVSCTCMSRSCFLDVLSHPKEWKIWLQSDLDVVSPLKVYNPPQASLQRHLHHPKQLRSYCPNARYLPLVAHFLL